MCARACARTRFVCERACVYGGAACYVLPGRVHTLMVCTRVHLCILVYVYGARRYTTTTSNTCVLACERACVSSNYIGNNMRTTHTHTLGSVDYTYTIRRIHTYTHFCERGKTHAQAHHAYAPNIGKMYNKKRRVNQRVLVLVVWW